MSGDLRQLRDRANNVIDGELRYEPAFVELARAVLALLDEHERLEASLLRRLHTETLKGAAQ